ncbi:MAG: sugar ABC transporter permease [Butyrivibrio sp.]|nr:sugar ABC transporter permease [Butyrivibrio sp.]
MEKIRNYWKKPEHVAYLFIAPAVGLLFIFRILPTAFSFVCGLFDIDMFLNGKGFVGLDNFKEMFQDDYFWNALKVTIKFTLIEVPIQMLVGLILAALLTKNNKFNKLMRAIYFAPIVCSATVVAIMWKMFLHSNIGIMTYWLEQIGIKGINFLNSPEYTFFVLVFMSVWRSFGMSTVILLSAMQGVSRDMYEAAEIDGCSDARAFISITLPLIKDTFGFVFMTRLIGSLQVFDLVFTTTSGGPARTTETLVYYTYTKAFSNNRMGYGAAVSMALFAIILVLTIFCYRGFFSEEKE